MWQIQHRGKYLYFSIFVCPKEEKGKKNDDKKQVLESSINNLLIT